MRGDEEVILVSSAIGYASFISLFLAVFIEMARQTSGVICIFRVWIHSRDGNVQVGQ